MRKSNLKYLNTLNEKPVRFFIRSFAHSLILALICSCAQIVAPTGGPVDKTPPKTVKYFPDSAALNFKSKQIRIQFNEYIQLKDINSQLIISPPMKYQPDVKVKSKELIVDINDTLVENTTYTFNFGNAVADLNEGNSIDNFQYVFSTGSFIDSLSLKGTVRDAFTLGTDKGILVMLYNKYDDSIPLKKLPSYFAKTKEDGSFKINNIRAGKYKVFALKDANADYLYNSPEETIAFLDTLVNIKKNTSVDLLMFKEIPKKQFVKRATVPEYGHVHITFNRPVTDFDMTLLVPGGSQRYHQIREPNKTNDTIDVWLPDYDRDSIKFIVSDDKKALDTLDLAVPARNNKEKKFRFTYSTNVDNGSNDLKKEIKILFNHPLKTVEQMNITMSEDSIDQKRNRFFYYAQTGLEDGVNQLGVGLMGNVDSMYVEDPQTGKMHLAITHNNKPWKESASYKVLIRPGSITDIFGLKNDSIKINFKTPELKSYGTLKLNINIPEKLFGSRLQLLNAKGDVISEQSVLNNKPIQFEYLQPQGYKFRLICDTNKNGVFDTGNYFKHQQPEKVIYYPGTISIRSNWDLEQDWKISE